MKRINLILAISSSIFWIGCSNVSNQDDVAVTPGATCDSVKMREAQQKFSDKFKATEEIQLYQLLEQEKGFTKKDITERHERQFNQVNHGKYLGDVFYDAKVKCKDGQILIEDRYRLYDRHSGKKFVIYREVNKLNEDGSLTFVSSRRD